MKFPVEPVGIGANIAMKLMRERMGNTELMPTYYGSTVDGEKHMNDALLARGGFPQQERMIRDRRKAMDAASMYSFQAAQLKKVQDCLNLDFDYSQAKPVRGLMNSNKLKVDYDEKILSVGFEHDFDVGDIFEWHRTNSFWIIYIQDLSELAYFKGQVRRCQYQIKWRDENGKDKHTYVSVRGPVETKIKSLDVHNKTIDIPNYSLNIIMPKNEDTMHQFQRYSKFYLTDAYDPDSRICWRVEATDSISTPGILEVTAVEYYSNKDEDEIDVGLVGTLITEPENPNPDNPKAIIFISGETFIKPRKEFVYTIRVKAGANIHWKVDKKYPVELREFINDEGFPSVGVKWLSTYSGQFDLEYKGYKKTIVVESLF